MLENVKIEFIDKEEMDDYLDYLEELSPFDLDKEIEWLKCMGEAKQNGKNLVTNNSFYSM